MEENFTSTTGDLYLARFGSIFAYSNEIPIGALLGAPAYRELSNFARKKPRNSRAEWGFDVGMLMFARDCVGSVGEFRDLPRLPTPLSLSGQKCTGMGIKCMSKIIVKETFHADYTLSRSTARTVPVCPSDLRRVAL